MAAPWCIGGPRSTPRVGAGPPYAERGPPRCALADPPCFEAEAEGASKSARPSAGAPRGGVREAAGRSVCTRARVCGRSARPSPVELQPQVVLQHLVVVRQAALCLPRLLQLLPERVRLPNGRLVLPATLREVADRAHQHLLCVLQTLNALLSTVHLAQGRLPRLRIEVGQGARAPVHGLLHGGAAVQRFHNVLRPSADRHIAVVNAVAPEGSAG
mmetsp:Transcript_43699/g.121538  ORF Transcript_43699/g.121538 Transcript_43699/m.121538 type:complete len:215 (-) Transcript_43699:374-1018(-)